MKIRKVKISKEGKVFIIYETPSAVGKGEFDEFTLRCSEAPLPEFRQAFQALVPHVAKICELPESYQATMKVSNVSFSWSQEVMGATITAVKTLKDSNAPLIINTPHKPEAAYSEGGDESNCLPNGAIEALYELMSEAKRYIRGEREQGKLPLEECPAADAADQEDQQEGKLL